MTDLKTYSHAYPHARLDRRDGILQVQIHDKGECAVWDAAPNGIHAELGDLFYRIGRDPENRVVIFTGTGDEFLTKMDLSSVGEINTQYWGRIYREGKDLLQNLLEIEVPVIGAVNGPAFIHAGLLSLSDIVVASDRASFADKAH